LWASVAVFALIVVAGMVRKEQVALALAAAATGFDQLGHRSARARVDLVRAEMVAHHGRHREALRPLYPERYSTRPLAGVFHLEGGGASALFGVAPLGVSETRVGRF